MNRGRTARLIEDAILELVASGLRADRPANPTRVKYYYSTDAQQLEVYIPDAGQWFVIG